MCPAAAPPGDAAQGASSSSTGARGARGTHRLVSPEDRPPFTYRAARSLGHRIRWGPIQVFDGAAPVGIRLLARLIRICIDGGPTGARVIGSVPAWREPDRQRMRWGRAVRNDVRCPLPPPQRAPTPAPLRLGPVAERPCYPPAPMRSCKHGPQCAFGSGRCLGRNPHPMPPRGSKIPATLASVPLGADAFFKDTDPGGLRSCWTTSRSAPVI